MADKITNDITLLFKTKLDEKSKQEVGKNLKSLLENAAIGFDEAETRRNLEPIVRMMQKLFDKAEIAFDADKLLSMPSRQALQEMAKMEVDQLQMAFDKALAKSGGVKIDFGDIGLSELAAPLKKIEDDLSGISKKISDTTKKSVYDIEKSLHSLSKNKAFKKIASPESIENALLESSNDKKIHPSRAVNQLEKARDLYNKSVTDDNPWVVQYKHLLEFVSKYEKLTQHAKEKIEAERPEFKQLYDTLSPKSGDVKISLEHYVDVAKGNELSEYKNQPWAREDTLKKVEQVLRNGITVKDGGGVNEDNGSPKDSSKPILISPAGSDENKKARPNTTTPIGAGESDADRASKLAREQAEEATKKAVAAENALVEARKVSTKDIYRTVYAPLDEEDLSREERKKAYGGAEIWSDSSEVANTYADGQDNPVMLRGNINASNAYIIDAKGANWNEFDKMKVVTPTGVDTNGKVQFDETSLRDKFPDLFRKIDNKEFGQSEDAQAELYQLIGELGHDVVVTRNVIDSMNPDYYKEPSTIYAVIDDKVLKVLDAFAMEEQEDEMITFEDEPHRENIPDYYKMPEASDIKEEAVAHQENTAAIVAEAKAVEQLNEEKVENQQLNAKEDVAATVEKPAIVVEPVGEVEAKSSIQTEELRQLLSAITYNVKVVQDTEPAEDNKISIDEAALESVLNRITYSVKIAYDDADKTANKIAIDESVLESTLKRVFTNVLNPNTEQNDSEPKNEPWALEKTLLSVKEVLDGIHTNTAKTDLVEITPASTEVGNVLATENTLAAIKTAVEAINKKVVKGTNAKTSDGGGKKSGISKKNAESYAGSQYFPEKLKTQTMQLAKFRAQLMTTGKLTDDVDVQIYELLDGLKQVQNGPDFSAWMQKFQQLKTSVGITDIFDKADSKEVVASYQQIIEFQKTRNKLELQYEKAQNGSSLKQFYAEQLSHMDSVIAKQQDILDNAEYEAKLAKMQEEQARKLGEAEAKAADKDAKKQATAAKKLAQREAMLGKTGSAVGRAESVWLSANDIEDPPKEFDDKINDYYQKLDAVRKMHQELKNSDMITEDQKKELIAQTMNINKMTEEIGELVSEYQKLSGDNATVIGTNTLDSDAGLGAYERQLKQAVATATNGKAQIKNFDAATKTLTYTVKTGKNEFTEYTAAVRRLDGQLISVQGTTKKTETFFEATARKMKELTSYFSGMAVFNRVGQELRRGIQYVREIDLALTELKKVTDETEETYDRFLETAAKTADKVGSTIQKVVSSTADWARLGYSMKEAAEFAESTQILMNVSEFTDVSQATDTLISAVQAFGYTAESSMDVVDLLNTIGKQNCRNYIVIYS